MRKQQYVSDHDSAAQPFSKPAARGPYSSTLLAKLTPPASSSAQVVRREIFQRVSGATSAKLVLVRAPAGFGKTTVLKQCLNQMQENGTDTAWLTLDQADNDVSRFLSCLGASVARMINESDCDTLSNDHSGSAHNGDIALDLVNRLTNLPQPFALFLDDFEVIQEPIVLSILQEILEQLPRRGQLFIGSRSLPSLPLSRLRARGQLVEIDSELLRLSSDETAEFFTQQRQLPLPAEDISTLHDKTEGWAAALWLASVALERRQDAREFIQRFSGSNEAIADYLADDVLASQPQQVKDFLLSTSILRQLSAPLCNALVPGTDSAEVLRYLESSNIFLTSIESEEKSYRYHSLFADFLRNQLERTQPDRLAALHHAAARWYEDESRPIPAIDHALDGGDFEHALQLLGEHAEELLAKGRMRLLSRWLDRLPEADLRRQPLLQIVHIWSVCFTRGPWEAMSLLGRAEIEGSGDREAIPYVRALRPVMLSMMDRFAEALEAGRIGLAHLPSCKPFADAVLANAMAYVFSAMGDYKETRHLLDVARSAQGQAASNFNLMYTESVEGMLDLQEGRLRQAAARFHIAVNATHSSSGGLSHGNALAGILHAGAVYESGDLQQAQRLLQVYVPMARDTGLPDHMLLGYTMLSRIAFHHGDVDQAFLRLTELEYLGHDRRVPRVVAGAQLERSRLLLLQGHLHAARNELERATSQKFWQEVQSYRLFGNDLDYPAMARLRWQAHAGNVEELAHALAELEGELKEAHAGSRQRRALKLQLLQVIALQRSGEPRAAQTLLAPLLRQACNEGFMRLLVDEGSNLGAVVQQFVASPRHHDTAPVDPIFSDYLQRLSRAFGQVGSIDADKPKPELQEPLTRKEIRILQLLAEGYSNNAMAEKLFVSESTVRTHLRNINAKLDAHSRTQAVAIARRLDILD